MKKHFLLAAAISAAATLSSCNDSKNTQTEAETILKGLEIQYDFYDDDTLNEGSSAVMTYGFDHDSQKRVVELTMEVEADDDKVQMAKISIDLTYNDDNTVVVTSNTYTDLNLSLGLNEAGFAEGAAGSSVAIWEYDQSGNLTKETSYEGTYITFEWADGNITKKSEYESNDLQYEYTIEYTEYKNPINIDLSKLMPFGTDSDYSIFSIAGLTGNVVANLPKAIEISGNNSTSSRESTATFEYEFDSKGYPTSATCTVKYQAKGDDGVTESTVATTRFIYE